MADLYDCHHETVRSFARRLVGDDAAAEDLVHDVFLAVPKALRRYRGHASVRTFLLAIAVHLARKHTRAAALAAGDRTGAERRLRALLAMASGTRDLRERASFALAELELARGATDAARVRLEALRAAADPDMVADAAFLEARAAETPLERAALLRHYIAGDPPSPYRECAMVDEALGEP